MVAAYVASDYVNEVIIMHFYKVCLECYHRFVPRWLEQCFCGEQCQVKYVARKAAMETYRR